MFFSTRTMMIRSRGYYLYIRICRRSCPSLQLYFPPSLSLSREIYIHVVMMITMVMITMMMTMTTIIMMMMMIKKTMMKTMIMLMILWTRAKRKRKLFFQDNQAATTGRLVIINHLGCWIMMVMTMIIRGKLHFLTFKKTLPPLPPFWTFGFIDGLFKKRVNVCCDKNWQNKASICENYVILPPNLAFLCQFLPKGPPFVQC